MDIPTNEHSSESRGDAKLSPTSKFVVELALQIVRLQRKKSIGTEHLLWGLVRLAETNKSTFSELFQDYGINAETLNKQLTETV